MKRRATVILRKEKSILFTQEKNGQWLLPGGKVEKNELPICAAVRELWEETGLVAESIRFMFSHQSYSNNHSVFLVSVSEEAHVLARNEVALVKWLTPDEYFHIKLTPATEKILDIASKMAD